MIIIIWYSEWERIEKQVRTCTVEEGGREGCLHSLTYLCTNPLRERERERGRQTDRERQKQRQRERERERAVNIHGAQIEGPLLLSWTHSWQTWCHLFYAWTSCTAHKPTGTCTTEKLIPVHVHTCIYCIARNFVGSNFLVFTDDSLTVKIKPVNKFNCRVHNGHECEHPWKLNMRNGKDRPSAKIEPHKNFPLYSTP